MNAHFLEPLDVLCLRGNRLFGDPGSYGESMVPPWPSAAAGAIRSAILARDGVDLAAFARGEPSAAHPTLGTPDEPAIFRTTDFQLAWHGPHGTDELQGLYPLPADLVVTGQKGKRGESRDGAFRFYHMTPVDRPSGVIGSFATVSMPVLAQQKREKPVTDLWLTEAGLRRWIEGELPEVGEHLVDSGTLWAQEERVGIAMESVARRADDGKLFTLQAVALKRGVGFLATVEGDGLEEGTVLRLGGDGRSAVVRRVHRPALQADLAAIAESRCGRILLTTPGVFPEGWRLPGMTADGSFELCGVRGRVICAAVSRAEVVSGWDLAQWRPKAAQRAAPPGSVYWLNDLHATPQQLAGLVDRGLWPESGEDAQRRAEGFNRFIFAVY